MFRFLRAVVPGPMVAALAQWIGLFSGTNLTLPRWEVTASNLSLAVGSALAALASILLKDWPKARLLAVAGGFALLFFMGVLACLYHYAVLGDQSLPQQVIALQDQWELVFVATMVSLIVAITLGALTLEEQASRGWRIFWSFCAVVGLSLIVAYGIIWLSR